MGNLAARKIRSFLSISFSGKLLFIEAVFTSAWVKMTLLFFPFGKVAKWLGSANGHIHENKSAEDKGLVKKVQFALKLCDRYTPWPTECYTQALTAKILLRRRNIPGVIYFGFRKNENNQLMGHAWFKSTGEIVTGFCDFSLYTVHSSFT